MTGPSPTNHRFCIIAEADPFLARLLQRFAEKSGLRTRRALTGEEVLALAKSEMPALIVLEPELPGKMRGWEAARALRADPQTRQIALILCSWLPEANALELVGQSFPLLQKPDLHYDDFAGAVAASGAPEIDQDANAPVGGKG